jgi:hypothetical protein
MLTIMSREMLTTAWAVGSPPSAGAAHRPSSAGRHAPLSAQAVGGRAGELADLGQDPELTEAQRGLPATANQGDRAADPVGVSSN